MTNTTSDTVTAVVLADELLAAARELRIAGRWERAMALLEAAEVTNVRARVRFAVSAAEVALESDWFGGTGLAAARLASAGRTVEDMDEEVAGERVAGPTEDVIGGSPSTAVGTWTSSGCVTATVNRCTSTARSAPDPTARTPPPSPRCAASP
ncbi:hypothetical protein ACFQ51_38675 [Streptomyces kaempferi]